MFEPKNLQAILDDFAKLPPGWHPEPVSAIEANSVTGNNCLGVKDAGGQILCIIPSNLLLDKQLEVSSSIAINRELVPLLCLDLLTCNVKIEAIQAVIKEHQIRSLNNIEGTAYEISKKITGILNNEKKEPETSGGTEPA